MAKLQHAEFKDGTFVSSLSIYLEKYSTEIILDRISKSSQAILKKTLPFRRNKTEE